MNENEVTQEIDDLSAQEQGSFDNQETSEHLDDIEIDDLSAQDQDSSEEEDSSEDQETQTEHKEASDKQGDEATSEIELPISMKNKDEIRDFLNKNNTPEAQQFAKTVFNRITEQDKTLNNALQEKAEYAKEYQANIQKIQQHIEQQQYVQNKILDELNTNQAHLQSIDPNTLSPEDQAQYYATKEQIAKSKEEIQAYSEEAKKRYEEYDEQMAKTNLEQVKQEFPALAQQNGFPDFANPDKARDEYVKLVEFASEYYPVENLKNASSQDLLMLAYARVGKNLMDKKNTIGINPSNRGEPPKKTAKPTPPNSRNAGTLNTLNINEHNVQEHI